MNVPLCLWTVAICRNTSGRRWGRGELPVGVTRYRIKCYWLGPVYLAIYPMVDRLRRWGIKPHNELLKRDRPGQPELPHFLDED